MRNTSNNDDKTRTDFGGLTALEKELRILADAFENIA